MTLFFLSNHIKDANKLANQFINQSPFDHIVIDNFLEENLAKKILEEFPTPDPDYWWNYNNPLEKKLAFNNLNKLEKNIFNLFNQINSNEFADWLSKLSGLNKVHTDPYLLGAGLHAIGRGGKLDIHEDFNIHKELKMVRKLNLILYLNKDWQDDWGGHLELWNKDMTVMEKKITPIFNRAVIFRTDMSSNHGHPHPLQCPENVWRKSIATYYYTEDDIKNMEYRSTFYKKLPGLDDGLDSLRELRKKGRLSNT